MIELKAKDFLEKEKNDELPPNTLINVPDWDDIMLDDKVNTADFEKHVEDESIHIAEKTLLEGTDADELVRTGFWYVPANILAMTIKNLPTDKAGALFVQLINVGSEEPRYRSCHQKYVTHDYKNPQIWTRTHYDGSWSDWTEVVRSTAKDETYTVSAGQVQGTLDRLPRVINHTITINVSGTISGNWTISNFSGVGRLNIAGAATLNGNMRVDNNTLRHINISNMNIYQATGVVIRIGGNRGAVIVNECTLKSDGTRPVGNNAVYADGSLLVYIQNTTADGIRDAFVDRTGKMVMRNNTIANCNVAYLVQDGGHVALYGHTITNTPTTYLRNGGGGIFTGQNGDLIP